MTTADAAVSPAAGLGPLLLQPWRELNRLPPLTWLAPQSAVRLLQADGGESVWLAGVRQRDDRARAGFTAVEVPADEVLTLPVQLPPLSDADRLAALELQVRVASPFEPDDLVWGWQPAAGTDDGAVVVVLASRRTVQSRIDQRLSSAAAPDPAVEAWAFDGSGRPVVLQGFGERARMARTGRGRLLGWLLLGLTAVLGVAAAVTPTVQLKLRAMQAQATYEALERDLGPVLAQREALVKAQAQRDALRALMDERVEPLAVLDVLTQVVPDDTWAQRVQVQGGKVTITGNTPNAAALMNRLSEQPQLRDVRAPGAAQRASGGRENFTIELALATAVLRPPAPFVAAAVVAPAPASAAAPPAWSPVPTATAAAAPLSPSPAPAPAATVPSPAPVPAPSAAQAPVAPAPAAAPASPVAPAAPVKRLFGGPGG